MGCCGTKHDNVSLHHLVQRNTQSMNLIPSDSVLVLQHGQLVKQFTDDTWSVLTPSTLYTFKTPHESSISQHEFFEDKFYLNMTSNLQKDVIDTIDLRLYKLFEGVSDDAFVLLSQHSPLYDFAFQCTSNHDKTSWCSSIRKAHLQTQSNEVSFEEFQRALLLIMNSKEVKDAMSGFQQVLVDQMEKDEKWRISLRNEMKYKPPNTQTSPFETYCKSKSNTQSLVRGFIAFEVENEVPSTVTQMIFDYLFQSLTCCFLSKSLSSISIHNELQFTNIHSISEEKMYLVTPFKSIDFTNHTKLIAPADLEYQCSFTNVQLTESLKQHIILCFEMTEDENLSTKPLPTDTRFDLIITKRRPSAYGGCWLHFIDIDSMLEDNELTNTGYSLQIKDINRECAVTYNRHTNCVFVFSGAMTDIFVYDLNRYDLYGAIPLNIDKKKWNKRRRDSASLCWLNDRKLMIIGGRKNGAIQSNVDLYDMEQNTLVSLSNMRVSRYNAASTYLKHCNEVVVGSEETIEFYDPNKDYWRLYDKKTKQQYSNSCFIWNDIMNPDILYLGENRVLDNNQCHIEWIDRRTNCDWKYLQTLQNVAYFGQFYSNPNVV